MAQPAFKRILLKLSGEALMGDDAYGINRETVTAIVAQVKEVVSMGVQVGIVIGGGNIFRGVAPAAEGMDRATADYMGMLATVMNAMALQDAMKHAGVAARVQSALHIEAVAEPYIRGKAIRYLEEGKVVIFGAGTGNRIQKQRPGLHGAHNQTLGTILARQAKARWRKLGLRKGATLPQQHQDGSHPTQIASPYGRRQPLSIWDRPLDSTVSRGKSDRQRSKNRIPQTETPGPCVLLFEAAILGQRR